jgi:pectate lyase
MTYTLPTIPIIGWAAVYGVTGGGSGTLHEFSSFGAMWNDMASVGNTPKNYIYTGPDVYLPDFHDGNARLLFPSNNKTILSNANQELLDGNLRANGRTNIIWANWKHRRTNNDCIAINSASMGIVITHCEFDNEDFPTRITDSIIDFKGESNFGQVSHNKMKQSWRCMGVGASASTNEDACNVTFALNRIEDTLIRRPRVNQGKFHIYANYYTNTLPLPPDSTKDVEVVNLAQIYSENNYYERGKTLWSDEDGNGALKSVNDFIGDYTLGTTEIRPENVTWSPQTETGYTYPEFTPQQAKDYIEVNAGATLFLTSETDFTLSLSSTTGGTVSSTPTAGTITAGTSITLSATPESGFLFSAWRLNTASGSVVSTNPNYSFNMPSSDYTLVGVFVSDTPIPPGNRKGLFKKRNT